MEIKEKQKLYLLYGIVGLVILIAYYYLLLRPQFTGFIANNREFCRVRSRVRSAEVLIANETRIRQEYETIKERAKLVEKRLLQQEEISDLLEDFSNIAGSSGVKILKIKPLEIIEGGSIFSAFPILIEAKAGYHQCGTFINKLENGDRLVKIESIDIEEDKDEPRYHDIKLKVITYVMK